MAFAAPAAAINMIPSSSPAIFAFSASNILNIFHPLKNHPLKKFRVTLDARSSMTSALFQFQIAAPIIQSVRGEPVEPQLLCQYWPSTSSQRTAFYLYIYQTLARYEKSSNSVQTACKSVRCSRLASRMRGLLGSGRTVLGKN